MSARVVLKFGGRSLGTPERVVAAAERVTAWRRGGWSPIVVVSACGSTTDRIVRWLGAVSTPGAPLDREFSRALVTGEGLAAALLASALIARGVEAVSLGAAEAGLLGTGAHGAAHIARVDSEPISRHLGVGRVPVVAGFQAVDDHGEVVTLERGGSDLTAVHLSVALGAEECHLVKDVGGIHARDPRTDPSAPLLPRLDPAEALALARAGARVLHPAAAALAGRSGVVLRVYGYRDPVFGDHGSTVAGGAS